jgi:heat shock protein HtpX
MTTFFIVVIGLGWTFSWIFGNTIILYVAVLIAVFMNIFAYWNSHKLVIKTSGATPADPNKFGELHNIVENLAITAGLPKPAIYIIDEKSPNAFATGRDEKHAVVAVTTGLMNILDRSELEGVIAHELSHIGNRDMLVSTISVVLVGFVTLLADFFLRWTFWGGHGGGDRDGRVQIFMIIIGIALMILAPIIAQLMHLAISRKREFLADASGALLTRYPDGLASALKKISSHATPMRRANHATAHLFISNPFGGKKEAKKFLNKLFASHPPTEERVSALLGK